MHLSSNDKVNLEKYLQRIAYDGSLNPNASTLRSLHIAHATAIPFENLDVLLGRPIGIDLESVQTKLVTNRRGGYCFEQNALFAAVLEQIGFTVTRLAARVRLGTTRVLPRTHMLLMVEADGQPWIADVGFGGWGLVEPIPFIADQRFQQGSWVFQLVRDGEYWVLQCPQCTLGPDQYAFTLDPFLPIDYEPANHYCSTFPLSRFVQTIVAQLPSPTKRVMLKDRELLTVTPDAVQSESIEDEEALLNVLRDHLGLHFPPGTRFGSKLVH